MTFISSFSYDPMINTVCNEWKEHLSYVKFHPETERYRELLFQRVDELKGKILAEPDNYFKKWKIEKMDSEDKRVVELYLCCQMGREIVRGYPRKLSRGVLKLVGVWSLAQRKELFLTNDFFKERQFPQTVVQKVQVEMENSLKGLSLESYFPDLDSIENNEQTHFSDYFLCRLSFLSQWIKDKPEDLSEKLVSSIGEKMPSLRVCFENGVKETSKGSAAYLDEVDAKLEKKDTHTFMSIFKLKTEISFDELVQIFENTLKYYCEKDFEIDDAVENAIRFFTDGFMDAVGKMETAKVGKSKKMDHFANLFIKGLVSDQKVMIDRSTMTDLAYPENSQLPADINEESIFSLRKAYEDGTWKEGEFRMLETSYISEEMLAIFTPILSNVFNNISFQRVMNDYLDHYKSYYREITRAEKLEKRKVISPVPVVTNAPSSSNKLPWK